MWRGAADPGWEQALRRGRTQGSAERGPADGEEVGRLWKNRAGLGEEGAAEAAWDAGSQERRGWTQARVAVRGESRRAREPWSPHTRSQGRGSMRLLGGRGQVGPGAGTWGARRSVLAGGVGSPTGTRHCEQNQLHRLRGPHYAPLSVCEDHVAEHQAGGPRVRAQQGPSCWDGAPGRCPPCPSLAPHPQPMGGWAGASTGPAGAAAWPPARRASPALFVGPGPQAGGAARWQRPGQPVGSSGCAWRAASHTVASLSSSLFQRNLHVAEFGVIYF